MYGSYQHPIQQRADIETHKPEIPAVKRGRFKGAGHSQARDGNSNQALEGSTNCKALIAARIPCSSSCKLGERDSSRIRKLYRYI